MNRRSGPTDLGACQRWRRFLESAADTLKINIVLTSAKKIERFPACAQCAACGSALKAAALPRTLGEDAESSERQSARFEYLLMGENHAAALQSCACRHVDCALEPDERMRIGVNLLSEICAIAGQSREGRSPSKITSLHYLNRVIQYLFRGDADILERALGLNLNVAVLLLDAEDGRIDFDATGRLVSVKTNKRDVSILYAPYVKRTLSADLQSPAGSGTMSIVSPVNMVMADAFLDFIVEECVMLIETDGLLKEAGSQPMPILDAVGSAVFAVDRSRNICYANQAAAKLLGRTVYELLTLAVSDLNVPWRGYFASAASEGMRGTKDRLLCALEEKLIDWEVLPAPGHARRTGWFVIAEDRTDVYRLQELREKTENLVEASTLLKVTAHEIRNPLATFKGLLQIIELKSGLPEISKYVNIGLNEIKKISLLLDEFSRFGKEAAVSLEVTDLRVFMEEILMLVNTGFSGPGIEIVASVDTVKPVLADSRQLAQAIFNLVKNAYEALEHNGRISLSLSQRDEKWVEITVSDNGPGISDRMKDTLFKPYFSTKTEGSGLGLAIAFSIVTNHSGTISVHNLEGGGACFSILLPVYRPENEEVPSGTDVLPTVRV